MRLAGDPPRALRPLPHTATSSDTRVAPPQTDTDVRRKRRGRTCVGGVDGGYCSALCTAFIAWSRTRTNRHTWRSAHAEGVALLEDARVAAATSGPWYIGTTHSTVRSLSLTKRSCACGACAMMLSSSNLTCASENVCTRVCWWVRNLPCNSCSSSSSAVSRVTSHVLIASNSAYSSVALKSSLPSSKMMSGAHSGRIPSSISVHCTAPVPSWTDSTNRSLKAAAPEDFDGCTPRSVPSACARCARACVVWGRMPLCMFIRGR